MLLCCFSEQTTTTGNVPNAAMEINLLTEVKTICLSGKAATAVDPGIVPVAWKAHWISLTDVVRVQLLYPFHLHYTTRSEPWLFLKLFLLKGSVCCHSGLSMH